MKQIIVITGATSGLGLSLALKFLQNEDLVVGVSRTRNSWKNALSKAEQNSNFILQVCDVSKELQVKRFISWVKRKFHKIDVLINNAGYGGVLSEVQNIETQEFQRHLSQNLLSCFYLCKHVIPFIRRARKGLIINISSMAGKRAVPKLVAYSVSKFGVVALSQAIAKENQDFGIKCITVCPGGMNTRMRAKIFGQEDANRQQSPDFVAGVILDVVQGKVQVDSGGDIVIRHGKISAVNPVPAP